MFRRRNDLTNEEHFGLIAADPGNKPVVVLDGKDSEWGSNGSDKIASSDGPVQEVRAVKDEQYLYLLLRLKQADSWHDHPITIGLDVRPGENRGLPDHPRVYPQADAALVLGPQGAQLFQAAWWEPTRILYGLGEHYMHVDPAQMEPGSGDWVHPLQIVSKPLTVPATGQRLSAVFHEISSLPIGSGDPADPRFDERTLVAATGDVVEVRLPWALLGYSDPSSKTLFEAHPDGQVTTVEGGHVGIAVLAAGSPLLTTDGYDWDTWDTVSWNERKKAGFDGLAQTMRDLSPTNTKPANTTR
jgi:hypothetical protein